MALPDGVPGAPPATPPRCEMIQGAGLEKGSRHAYVAIIDPLPMFREGVANVLSAAGHQVETPTDPLAGPLDGRRPWFC